MDALSMMSWLALNLRIWNEDRRREWDQRRYSNHSVSFRVVWPYLLECGDELAVFLQVLGGDLKSPDLV